ncbi:MAG: ATP-binding cassette domain-containing protein [Pseudomonadota bacterium]
MARPPLLSLQDVSLTFGGTPLLSGADLFVAPGERIALVGRNGSGKSTLLKIAAGDILPDSGTRFQQPDATVRYLAQEPDLSAYATVGEYVRAGLPATLPDHAGERALTALGLDPDASPKTMSGGEARRAAIAHALAPEPDVLLLDEPTNHLDIAAIGWLEQTLKARRGALVLISHDRAFLNALGTSVVWLDRGRSHRMEGAFSGFEDWRDGILAAEDEERRRLDKKIAQEEEWLRYGVTARRKRNMGRLRNLQTMRQERRDARKALGTAEMGMAGASRSGQRLIVAEGISKTFPDAPVANDVSLTVMRGDRLGLVGKNGAGKTTLVKMLLGALTPDAGTVKFGTDLAVNIIDQKREDLAPNTKLREAINPSGGDMVTIGGTSKHVAGYLKDFLFTPEQFNTPVSALSGGERARVLLGRAFAKPCNVLVLDEPTNDLDLETLDLLAEVIADFDGTLILVSHDRDFLDRTVTSTLVSQGNGHWQDYPGGYSDMLTQGGPDLAAINAPPPAPQKPKTAKPKPKPSRAKLSFREKHDLETLPATIDKLEAEITKLSKTLADPNLYAKDPKRFDAVTTDLAARQTERDAAEERWLELELKREALAS